MCRIAKIEAFSAEEFSFITIKNSHSFIAWGGIYTLREQSKKYIETFITYTRFDDLPRVDDLDDFKKKMGQELSIMATYKDPFLAQVYKRILRIKEILQMQNDQNQTTLELLHIDFNIDNYPDDLQLIQEVELLLNGTKLDADFNELKRVLTEISNSEKTKKLDSVELIPLLDAKLDQNNLALQIYKNCASLN